jgi:predicted CoA-binding protein
MKHMNATEVAVRHLLQRARTIAVVGASPDPAQHSHTVVSYLSHAGYDVIPVRPDRAEVAGLPTYARLADFGGPVDLVVIFQAPEAVVAHIEKSAAKHAEAVWLPPGAWTPAADESAQQHGLTLIKERCILEDHRHLSKRSGHPGKWGVHVRLRKRMYEDNRKRPDDQGYVSGGGGGHVAGGGARSIRDEKKMGKGKPSPRSGPMKPRPR